MKKIIVILLVILPAVAYTQKQNGLNINIYKKISGLWLDVKTIETFYKDKPIFVNSQPADFGWGKSKYLPNSLLIIDPIGNKFQFIGLHLCSFKSLKEIKPDLIEIELNFYTGDVLRYRVQIEKNGDISFVDNGSTISDYQYPKEKFRRVEGPNFIDGNYGIINTDSVRIRKNPSMNGEIIGIIPKNEIIISIIKSPKKDLINKEEWYWYKIVSNNGYVGWVYGKYILFK